VLLPALVPTAQLPPEQVRLTVLAAGLTVLVAWTLLRGLDVAISWWLMSYDDARRNLEEAREHRGRLVQALSQLDDAYYRLRRTNAALAEAWRTADHAERAKAEFITNISHELRTPLNLIAGFSEMMLAAPASYGGLPLPREYRGDLHAVYRSAQHLLALTDDVLDLAQAEMSHLALIRETTDLAAVVRESADIVREYIETKGLHLQLQIAEGLPPFPLDALRIRQVLLNLLTNAARFTEQGGITVAVASKGQTVQVTVADTGRGLTAEQRERIFQEFQHVDLGAAREHRSTGLGLPISRKFIELHGGSMWLESIVGKGTTFRFTLPIAEQPDGTPTDLGRRPGATQPSERLLVLARTDERLQRLLQRRFGGYRVIIADIADASQLAGPAPRIYCSLPHEEHMLRTLGATAYLVKPVARAALQAAIGRLRAQPRCILIVDDDLHSVRLLSRMLKAGGRHYALLTAHNGTEALERMRAQQPDLVLLDLVMPGGDGREVLDAMAGDPALAQVPVIVVSGREQAEEALRLPGELRLSRPEGFGLRELMDLLEALLAALPPSRAYLSTDPQATGAVQLAARV